MAHVAVELGLSVNVDVKTVAASMHQQGLKGISPCKFNSVAALGSCVRIRCLIERRWDAGALDADWISDITYLRTP